MKENNVVTSETKDALSYGHSRIPLCHLHILVTEYLADGLHRHTCLQRSEAGERVSSRMVRIGKSVLFSTSTSKAFWMEKQQLLDVLVGLHGFLALVLLWLL